MATALNLSLYESKLELARQHKGGGLIERGSTHRAAVRSLQQRLSDLGFEISTDGIFGDQTEQALRDFQKRSGATVDGVLGPKTLDKLLKGKRPDGNTADPSIDAIQRVVGTGQAQTSSAGKGLGDAKAVQRGGGTRKATRGRGKAGGTPKGPNGGAIDPVTGAERATSSTGPIGSTVFGKPTKMTGEDTAPHVPGQAGGEQQPQDNNHAFNELHPRAAGGKFAAKGDSGAEVQNTQTALNTVDKANLKTDGEFGPKTEQAVKSYQKSAGLKVDGIVGLKTSASLRRRLKMARS